MFAALISDATGVVRQIVPVRERDVPLQQISDRQYFIDAMSSGKPAISDVLVGRLSHVPIVTIATPLISGDGPVEGVVGGSLDLSKFQQFIDQEQPVRLTR